MLDLFGFRVHVVFWVGELGGHLSGLGSTSSVGVPVLAYAWHFGREKAWEHLHKIAEYHSLEGRSVESPNLECWLKDWLQRVVIQGSQFSLPPVGYRHREVYEAVLQIPKGRTRTYSEVARQAQVPFPTLLSALMRNPFQVLIPCHRLVTRKGTLMGFYPLGKPVKARLLAVEGTYTGADLGVS